ncbi:MAG: hypothetical protein QNK19_12545 [Xanthomonadales bacterium]|nr:hypothetical protein [Xanthomonadales bacterium]
MVKRIFPFAGGDKAIRNDSLLPPFPQEFEHSMRFLSGAGGPDFAIPIVSASFSFREAAGFVLVEAAGHARYPWTSRLELHGRIAALHFTLGLYPESNMKYQILSCITL